MVDFKKKLGKKVILKKINPLEIYDSLDRKSETGPLRPAQEFILKEWYANRQNDNNLIIKLHTGQGKTLIGLLMLHSRLNSNNSPCLYICPNIYLVKQTILEAKKFGIPYCTFDSSRDIPESFLNGEKILITHVQKVFNGKTIFGLDNKSINVDHVILDDSHACIDSLKSTFTITIKKEENLYSEFINLFSEDLSEQGEGSFLDIKNAKYESILPIPYWSWVEKKSEVLNLLSSDEDNKSIQFAWPLMKNNLNNYRAIVSGNHIELTPYYIPMHHFGTFNNAKQRILMSATTQDDSFFIKGLGFDINSIKNPLIDPNQKWSGEKMLLLPSLIDESLHRDAIIEKLAVPSKKKVGFVSLVPSFRLSKEYEEAGSIISDSSNIFEVVQHLKSGEHEHTVVIVNRYDGIDLPDNSCRLLIIDSKPFFMSLSDRYEENCRKSSDVINTKIAQKIEQGLGRSVRGEKDYSTVVLIGGDLVKFIKSTATNKYFSSQTRQQIAIGLEIAEAAKEDLEKEDKPYKVITSLLKQSLTRDEGWKEYYKEQMDEIIPEAKENHLLELFKLEHEAENYHYNGDSEKASQIIQKVIDNNCSDESEKGWYLQSLARYLYSLSKIESTTAQKSAFKKNYQLLHPKGGIVYKKLSFINQNRISRIKEWVNKHSKYEELMLSVNNITDELVFGMPSEKFESSLQELGLALGLLSQRPDKEFKKGPDNLWCINDNYIMFECKSEVLDTRSEINKHEASQMNSHCGWFEESYQDKKVKRILIIPTKNLSYHANFTHSIEIMRKNRLKKLRLNFQGFFREFKNYEINDLTDDKINDFLLAHNLDINSLSSEYSEECYHRKK
ncbi:DEAD/DEAH box helicase family protein [Cellulophaga sp. HaHa_2_95]|uniref:DEAD/DEAH box helicase family protein n=1 Tax=Cellulophaga sp. HaHa_2_95 TaxID=2745558 RepID=UPI001C4F7431|nr:DEAD/DEAH box helicase family protein [Cellulophaga sp. HaHa_2_95]QXP56605.1 DEAD/DEAH box helicase family protein [Cellulophaga sp. HaHa_2_95]